MIASAIIRRWHVLLFILLSAFGARATAQPAGGGTSMTELETVHGEFYRGQVIGARGDTLHFRTAGGVALALPMSSIREMSAVRGREQGAEEPASDDSVSSPQGGNASASYLPPKLNRPATSLFVMPTAYPIRAGEVHLGLFELFFASGNVGIADIAEVHAGTVLVPGLSEPSYYTGAKICPYQSQDVALSAGAVFTSIARESDVMMYGVGTIRLGGTWISAGYSAGQKPFSTRATFGLDVPVSRVTRLMSEIWIPVESRGAVISVGARFETGIANIDMGFYFPIEQPDDYITYLPFLSGTIIL